MVLLAKNYQNRPMFHGVILKINVAQFFKTRCTIDVNAQRASVNIVAER